MEKNETPHSGRGQPGQPPGPSAQTALARMLLRHLSEHGLSTLQLANRSGLNQQTIRNILYGRHARTTRGTLLQLSQGTGIPLETLEAAARTPLASDTDASAVLDRVLALSPAERKRILPRLLALMDELTAEGSQDGTQTESEGE